MLRLAPTEEPLRPRIMPHDQSQLNTIESSRRQSTQSPGPRSRHSRRARRPRRHPRYCELASNFLADGIDEYCTEITPVDEQCVICLEGLVDEHDQPGMNVELVEGDNIMITTPSIRIKACKHAFHYLCLEKWVLWTGKRVCPLCKIELFTLDEE
ncbi:hypothetical protein BDV96DRAFT_573335 [Lophiotrema nucula]|uniref:RING-type domain-containing protein n=1 Tax=Lophiotrema nucula TaxID=690887 RepID=A0A6A5ZA73_9PLEO|nr:hypothetical protein BDV96DRAFT_573335 [Lophiotrema nucula]